MVLDYLYEAFIMCTHFSVSKHPLQQVNNKLFMITHTSVNMFVTYSYKAAQKKS